MRLSDIALVPALALLLASCGNPKPATPDEPGGGGGGDVPDGPVAVASVSLNETSVSVEVDASVTLQASIFPPTAAVDWAVGWSSEDPSIAAVSDNGTVTGKAEGSTRVTAKAGGKSAVCRVTVTKKTIHVVSVSVEPSLTLTEGESAVLTAVVLPENADDRRVSWTVRDADIAAIEANGLSAAVTVLSAGSTVVTVTAADGALSAACNITVVPKPKDASFDKNVYYAYPGLSFTPELFYSDGSPATASAWTVSGGTYAEVSGSGLVSVTGTGTGLLVTALVNGDEVSAAIVSEVTVDTGASVPLVPGSGAIIALPIDKGRLDFSINYRDSVSGYANVPAAAISGVGTDDDNIARLVSSATGWTLKAVSVGSTTLNFSVGSVQFHVPVSVTESIPSDGSITYPEDNYGPF